MIDKQIVREISNFIAAFLGIFETFICTEKRWIPDGSFATSPLNIAFKVSGAIEGYLIVSSKDQPGVEQSGFLLKSGFSAGLIECYNRKAAASAKLSAFRIDVLNENFADDIIYTARKAEPQISMRIQVKNYTIELYAFTHQVN